jgi:hypothetical protein
MPMSEQSAGKASDQAKAQKPRGLLTAGAIALVGGALTVGALMFAAGPHSDSATAGSNLAIVAQADIAGASATLNPGVAGQLASEAKSCSVPLARVTIVKAAGAAGGTIQIKSGDYVSPTFQVTDAPQQVAIPFPAPYATGHGVLSVEGSASGATILLTPGWKLQSLNGSASHNVVWTPRNPCQ